VINTNLPPILHRFRYIAFDRSKSSKPLYLAIPLAFNPIGGRVPYILYHRNSLKTRYLGYIPVAESLGISSTTFAQCAPEATEFGEIPQNKDHYAIQGHSMSPILVPVESSCIIVINTINSPPILCTVSEI